MTIRGIFRFRSLCAALAALLLLVSMPATAAFNACDDGGGTCLINCEPGCDLDVDGQAPDSKGCAHCAFSHVGHSIATPADDENSARFDASASAYARLSDARIAAAPGDGPEHPPKA